MGFWERAQKDPGWLAVVEPDGTERVLSIDAIHWSNRATYSP